MNSDHEVLVKVTEIGDAGGQRTEDRVGSVLIVRGTESAETVRGSFAEVPKDASTIIKIVTQNEALDGDRHEVLSKASLIGRTWIETIEVGVTVPA